MAGKEGTEPMEKSQELIGILQAISIVAKSLAAKLAQMEFRQPPLLTDEEIAEVLKVAARG